MKKHTEENNPYTLQFSFVPPQFIERTEALTSIVSNFTKEVPTYRGMFITGVRGCGKTVMLNYIRKKISQRKDWITVDINTESNLIDSLARALYLIPEIRNIFIKAKLDFSLIGIGVHIENAELIASDESDALTMMMRALKKAGKKVLVTIDEITYSKDVAKFSHALSSFAGEEYEIYVLMTGLAENINKIRNEKSLTFLYRAKVIELDMLNIKAISYDYSKTLGIPKEQSDALAYETFGYSLAFQAFGYHAWNALGQYGSYDNIDKEELLIHVDITLAEMAYDKIWSELSATDKKILIAVSEIISESGDRIIRTEDIRNRIGMSSNTFTTYRTRLMTAGIIDGSQFGYIKIKLPRFAQYINSIPQY